MKGEQRAVQLEKERLINTTKPQYARDNTVASRIPSSITVSRILQTYHVRLGLAMMLAPEARGGIVRRGTEVRRKSLGGHCDMWMIKGGGSFFHWGQVSWGKLDF